ncbi:MAG: hypothetical protein ACRBK7_20235 [Acidimicrobiales bacterium]
MSDIESSPERSVATGGDGIDLAPSFALAVALIALPLIVVGCIFFAIIPGPWWIGIPLGLLIAAGLVWLKLRSAATGVLSKLGGGLLQADGSVRLENLVRGLSLAGGVEEPEILVLSDPARNAMAVRSPTGGDARNHLVVTQGLLQSLEVVELEGVVAELLTRLKNGDAESATVAAALFGQPILDGPLSAMLRPIASIGLGRLLSDDRDLEADRQAVSLTRYPPGLFGALRTMSQGDVAPKSYTEGLAHLWLIDPTHTTAGQLAPRTPLDLRIDVLAEL